MNLLHSSTIFSIIADNFKFIVIMDYKQDELFLEANQLITDQKIREALNLLIQILEEQPDYGRAHNLLGWLYEYKLDNYDRAERHYKSAMQFSPGYPPGYINYASFLTNMQRFDELKNHLEKCLSIPGIIPPYVYKEFGIMYELTEQYDKAIEYYKLAIKKTLSINDIEEYEQSIERCKKKSVN